MLEQILKSKVQEKNRNGMKANVCARANLIGSRAFNSMKIFSRKNGGKLEL
jgi:hypothetical protein